MGTQKSRKEVEYEKRKISIRVEVDGRAETHSTWVDKDATDDERQSAVDEVVGDVDSWSDGEVELMGFGETGMVKDHGFGSIPYKLDSW